jgi:murein L,D-transpeptidase YcbB/YkuD
MRHIYKKLVIAAILLAPFSVAAQTVDVSALIAQITQLQTQLTAQLTARKANNRDGQCITITRTLSKGISSADVTQLQNFLIAQGMLAAGNNTGYFGNLTEAAVMKWQAAHGIEAVGNVGPKTRAAMAACSGSTGTVISNQCPNVTQPANCSNPVAVQLNGCTVGWQCSVSTLSQQTFTATPLPGP